MTLTGEQFIGFEPKAQGQTSFQAVNPATGLSIAPNFVEATSEEVHMAVQKATQAFLPYQQLSSEQRAIFLDAIGEHILALGDQLINRAQEETALPQGRLQGERGRTINQLKLFAEVVREGSWVDARIDKANPDRTPFPKPDIRQMLIPLGPVAVFGASNFPLAFSVAGGDTASALASGCPVVIKAHPAHPGTSELVFRAILQAAEATGMPDGVASMVQGGSIEVGQALVSHPGIQAVGFTGSLKGGRALFNLASQRPNPIPVYAEMGSTNPVFLLPGALKERREALASGLIQSVSLGVGQFCTNPGIVFGVESEETNQFLAQIERELPSLAAGTMLTANIHQSYVHGLGEVAATEGIDVLAKGKDHATPNFAQAAVMRAQISDLLQHPELEEEVFGPSTIFFSGKNKTELLAAANSLSGHLTATIHGTEEDLMDYQELISILQQKVGRLIFNGFPTGVEVCHSMMHGGPYPATTDSRSTSVGTLAIKRFARPFCFQAFPEAVLPPELQDANPRQIWRLVDGTFQQH
ncbi:MAG: aldehyde dehydrogenase (NADP(+)) [Bacteroidota bacterium]